MTTMLSPASSSMVGAVPPRAKTSRGTKPRFRAWKVAAGIAVIALAAFGFSRWTRTAVQAAGVDRHVVAPQTFNVVLKEKGELKAAKSTDIKCEVEGKSTIISLIEEGTPVKEGDLLVELASNEIDDRIQKEELTESNAVTAFEAAKAELDIQRDQNASSIRKAELQIELKRLELEKYEKGDWVQKLKDAEIAIQQASITLHRREQDYTASKELLAKKYITQTEYDEDEFNFKKAQWELEKSNKALEVLNTYTYVAEHRQRQSDLEEAIKECERVKKNAEAEDTKKTRAEEGKGKELALTREQLAKLRTQKSKCRIVAPTQGFVVYYADGGGRWMMSESSQIKEGATVFEQQILMQLPDTSTMTASIRVHEAKTDKLKVGQAATVTVEGLPGQRFSGKVTKIAALADSQSGWLNPDLKEYQTEITLDTAEVPLKPGVTAHAEILVEGVENSLAVPVQAIYTKGTQRYVFRDGGDTIYTAVELGAIGTEWAEVRSGLSAGDKVRLAFSDDDRRAIPDVGPEHRGGGMKMKTPPGGVPASSAQSARPARSGSDSNAGKGSSGRKP